MNREKYPNISIVPPSFNQVEFLEQTSDSRHSMDRLKCCHAIRLFLLNLKNVIYYFNKNDWAAIKSWFLSQWDSGNVLIVIGPL